MTAHDRTATCPCACPIHAGGNHGVWAAILGDPRTKLSQISVETLWGTVQLSGFVDTPVAATRAERLASEVKGVKSVKNDIVIR